jgi:serine/threonine-protein kinase
VSEGFRLGRYQLLKKIAVGGMAEIWLAQQAGPAGFSKQLVIKKILPHLAADKAFVDMFLNEGRVAALINHPNVVQVFELAESGSDYYLVMEHVPGWSLRAIVTRAHEAKSPMPYGVAAHLVIGLCHGLHAAHELVDPQGRALGLVHRDISPENVLVARGGQAKVTDFGIAKATAAASGTRPGELKGKIAYMPPEQLTGKPLDRRTDLYAVGAILYEVLSGRRAFEVPADAALSTAILQEKPPPLRGFRPDVPAQLEAIIDKALSKDPNARYATALAMARELEAFVAATRVPTSAVADWLTPLFPPETIAPLATPMPGTAKLEDDSLAPTVHERKPPPRRLWPVALAATVSIAVVGFYGVRMLQPPAPVPSPALAQKDPPPVAAATPDPEPVPSQPAPSQPAPTQPTPPEPVAAPQPAVARSHGPAKPSRGKLLVRVNPWADVVVDGRMVGATPLSPLDVSAGKHSVTVTNSELGKTKTVAVEVRANRQELVEINLKP